MIFEVAICDLKNMPTKTDNILRMPKHRGPVPIVESRILFLRRKRVILDADLARTLSSSSEEVESAGQTQSG